MTTTHEGETKEERKRRRQQKRERKEQRELKRKRRREERSSVDGGESTSNATATPNLPTPSSVHQTQQSQFQTQSQSQLQEEWNKEHTSSQSSFQRKTAIMLVSLVPASLGNVKSAIQRSIRTLLLRFSDSLGGVLLAFDNIHVKEKDDSSKNIGGHGSCGIILGELPHIHFRVQVDVLLFCPNVGRSLTGIVNEVFPSHVGILVHSYFNAMVSADHLREAGFQFDRNVNEWKDKENQKILFGNTLQFIVEKLHESNGIISLEVSDPSIPDIILK
mmetsp:Transcript_4861/g.6991  ORF Transcript_4861/g.6991 Transcript_4861/m.6991 type:complete len:275 (+) Transcript_4861:83-907(+)|eukprot:CAMPEP_0184872282 /NCGR_PEP_ID=MMETSP0580-20130426/41196_1 /TAXON_ID=1118495 /ORGANISM="Dactyliosolen fragilissimus" /LENGTH=274 /DNA_ID=CAMNT_0027375051 /DNA_START=9 /DNA_END=833 /DNA_ORIENTATION=+